MEYDSWFAVMLVNRNDDRQFCMMLIIIIIIIIIIMYVRVLSLMCHNSQHQCP